MHDTPDLRLIAVSSILLHEHPETQRTERLKKRLNSDAFLKNPPIVADAGNNQFMLLDGANRVRSFELSGIEYIPVQVIDYDTPEIELSVWHHLLITDQKLHLQQRLEDLTTVKLVKVGKAASAATLLKQREALAVFVDKYDQSWAVLPSAEKLEISQRATILKDVVDLYEGMSNIERIKIANFDNLPEVIQKHQHNLILFPTFLKAELVSLARANILIPTGLSRHIIPGRVLQINIPLEFLYVDGSYESKCAYFRKFIDDIVFSGRMRLYEEAVYIMNE